MRIREYIESHPVSDSDLGKDDSDMTQSVDLLCNPTE